MISTLKDWYYYLMQLPSSAYHEVRNGIRGLIYWAPFAWKWRSWDYQWGLDALAHHLRKLEEVVRGGYSMNRKVQAREIRIALHLLERIKEAAYYEEPLPDCLSKEYRGKHSIRREKEDWEFLWEHFGKKMQRWWD